MLEGELLVDVEGERHTVRGGGVFVAPRGVPHAFMVTSETAHLLAMQTPGTGDAFYRAATEPVRSPEDAARPPDWERLREAARSSDSIELLGPPPFAVEEELALATRS